MRATTHVTAPSQGNLRFVHVTHFQSIYTFCSRSVFLLLLWRLELVVGLQSPQQTSRFLDAAECAVTGLWFGVRVDEPQGASYRAGRGLSCQSWITKAAIITQSDVATQASAVSSWGALECKLASNP